MTLVADAFLATGGAIAPATGPNRARTRLEALLPAILAQLGWRRAETVYDRALSAERGIAHLDEAALFLASLEFTAWVSHRLPREWMDGLYGAVIALKGDNAYAIVRVNGRETALSSDAAASSDQIRRIVEHAAEVLYCRHLEPKAANTVVRRHITDRIRRGYRHGLFLSFFVNAFAVTIPLFTMAIFDRVIGANAPNSLWPLVSGALIAVLAVTYLRRARTVLLAAMQARLGTIVEQEMETRLLRGGLLSMQRQSTARIDARIASVRRVAELFASSNTAAVFDAPFVLLSILVIGFVGGILAVVPAVYLVLFVIIAVAVARGSANTDPEFAKATQDRTALLHELATSATELRETRVAGTWLHRFADVSGLAGRGAHRAGVRQAAIQSLGSILGSGAALATLIVGVDLAINGVITPGTLVATMLLTWRITGPAQAFFLGLPRIQSIWRAMGAIEQALAVPTVTTPAVALEHVTDSAPMIEAAGIFFRYDQENDPALAGVSFTLEPGSITAVIGPNGAGKSTLLRVLAGTLAPQSGTVRMNGVTLRQFDPEELGATTLNLPAMATGLAGSEAVPDSAGWNPLPGMQQAMSQAIAAAHAPSDTRPHGGEPTHAYMLLDDPTALADAAQRAAFLDFLSRRKGLSTVVFSTHDTSLLSVADKAIVLNNGALVYAGPVKQNEANASDGMEAKQ